MGVGIGTVDIEQKRGDGPSVACRGGVVQGDLDGPGIQWNAERIVERSRERAEVIGARSRVRLNVDDVCAGGRGEACTKQCSDNASAARARDESTEQIGLHDALSSLELAFTRPRCQARPLSLAHSLSGDRPVVKRRPSILFSDLGSGRVRNAIVARARKHRSTGRPISHPEQPIAAETCQKARLLPMPKPRPRWQAGVQYSPQEECIPV